MLNQSQNVSTAGEINSTLKPETLNALTEKFQDFIQTFLALNQETPPQPNPPEAPKKAKEPDQIRCYRVPGYIVKDEQAAFKEHRAENLLDLLYKARNHFYLTSLFMRNFYETEDISGCTLQLIGQHLEQPLAVLDRLCDILADYKPQTTSLDC